MDADDVAAFVRAVRTCSVESRATLGRASDATVAVRVRAVLSFYRYHAATGVGSGTSLVETITAVFA